MSINPIQLFSANPLELQQQEVKEQLATEAANARAGIGAEYKIPTTAGNISVWDSQTAEKKTMILIHGSSASKEIYMNQFKSSLSEEYRLIAIDLPGHGESDNATDPEAQYNLITYSQVVRDVVNYLDIPSYSIVGWSLGGHVAIETLDDQKLENIIITGTPPIPFTQAGFVEGFYPSMKLDLLPQKLQEFGDQELQPLLSQRKAFDEKEAHVFHAYAGLDTFEDENLKVLVLAGQRTDGLAREKCVQSCFLMGDHNEANMVVETEKQVIAIQGEFDAGVNNSYVKSLMGDQCVILPGAGHGLVYTNADAFNDLIRKYVN